MDSKPMFKPRIMKKHIVVLHGFTMEHIGILLKKCWLQQPVNSHLKEKHQGPFQEPQLEVPTPNINKYMKNVYIYIYIM